MFGINDYFHHLNIQFHVQSAKLQEVILNNKIKKTFPININVQKGLIFCILPFLKAVITSE